MQTVRQLRHLRGVTQAELGRAIGCSAAQVASWENGAAPLPDHRRAALARYFGVKPGEIDAPKNQRAQRQAELAGRDAEIDRLMAENRMLRARLGILDDEDAAPPRRRRHRPAAG